MDARGIYYGTHLGGEPVDLLNSTTISIPSQSSSSQTSSSQIPPLVTNSAPNVMSQLPFHDSTIPRSALFSELPYNELRSSQLQAQLLEEKRSKTSRNRKRKSVPDSSTDTASSKKTPIPAPRTKKNRNNFYRC